MSEYEVRAVVTVSGVKSPEEAKAALDLLNKYLETGDVYDAAYQPGISIEQDEEPFEYIGNEDEQ